MRDIVRDATADGDDEPLTLGECDRVKMLVLDPDSLENPDEVELTEADADPVVSIEVLDETLGDREAETEDESELDLSADTDAKGDNVDVSERAGEFDEDGLPVIALDEEGDNDGYAEGVTLIVLVLIIVIVAVDDLEADTVMLSGAVAEAESRDVAETESEDTPLSVISAD